MDQPPCEKCGGQRAQDFLRQQFEYNDLGQYVKTEEIHRGGCYQCGAAPYLEEAKDEIMSGTYAIGCFTNGIVRSGVGVAEIPPHFDEPGAAPVPTTYVDACQCEARASRVPVGSGWVQGIVKGSSLADARMKACDLFAHIPEDTGPSDIVVMSDAETYSDTDGAYIATLNAEQHTMLSSGRMRVCDIHIKDKDIVFLDDLIKSNREMRQTVRDIITPITGGDLSRESLRDYLSQMDFEAIVEWADDVLTAVINSLDA